VTDSKAGSAVSCRLWPGATGAAPIFRASADGDVSAASLQAAPVRVIPARNRIRRLLVRITDVFYRLRSAGPDNVDTRVSQVYNKDQLNRFMLCAYERFSGLILEADEST
jgi:hypothetical protein